MTTSGSTSTEPWNEEKTTNPATSNTQNIYQKGNVGIGKDSPLTKLDVAGAARIGYHNDASATVGSNSLAVGTANVASGENSFAQGNSAIASGTNSVALGSEAKAGLNSYAIGNNADATKVTGNGNLFSIGEGTKAEGNGQLALGRYNAPSTAAVVVGIGNSSQRKNAMTIEDSGVVTILDNNGSSSRSAALKVDGRSSFNKPVYLKDQLYDNNNTTGNDGQVLAKNGGQVRWVNDIAVTPAVAAVFPRTERDMRWGQEGTTGAYIDLPTGKWAVEVTLLIDTYGIRSNEGGWFRCSFSESLNSVVTSPDLLGSKLASGSITGPTRYGTVDGTIIVNNTSGRTKRYYLFKTARGAYLFGNARSTFVARNFGRGTFSEDQIVAYPMN